MHSKRFIRISSLGITKHIHTKYILYMPRLYRLPWRLSMVIIELKLYALDLPKVCLKFTVKTE